MKDPQKLTREVTWWAPHYDEVKTTGTLPEGTIVSIRDESHEPQPNGRGHMYYLLEWEGGSGWTRTYHPDPFPPRWVPVDETKNEFV